MRFKQKNFLVYLKKHPIYTTVAGDGQSKVGTPRMETSREKPPPVKINDKRRPSLHELREQQLSKLQISKIDKIEEVEEDSFRSEKSSSSMPSQISTRSDHYGTL